jgi:hypothetical protein
MKDAEPVEKPGLCIFCFLCGSHNKTGKTTKNQHKYKTIQINHQNFGDIVLFIFFALCYNNLMYAPENTGIENCSQR